MKLKKCASHECSYVRDLGEVHFSTSDSTRHNLVQLLIIKLNGSMTKRKSAEMASQGQALQDQSSGNAVVRSVKSCNGSDWT